MSQAVIALIVVQALPATSPASIGPEEIPRLLKGTGEF
jgi:hypothetical protein